MEQKDTLTESFFLEFKKTYNIGLLFNADHPTFLKAIDAFRHSLDPVFAVTDPIRIGIARETFYFGSTPLTLPPLYQEMARMLHLRRIKEIIISKDVTVDELAVLFKTIALHPKEIAAGGGLRELLQSAKVSRISVEELDYSQLLRSSGAECKDVWVFLLGEAVANDDSAKASSLAETFDGMIKHFSFADIVKNDETRENIIRFLSYLKAKKPDAFNRCAKEAADAFLRARDLDSATHGTTIQRLVEVIGEHAVAEALSEGLASEGGLNPANFGLFASLLSGEQHEKVSAQLGTSLHGKAAHDTTVLKKNIEKMLKESPEASVSQVYRNSLASFLARMTFTNRLNFNRELIRRSYAFVLLELLLHDPDEAQLTQIAKALSEEIPYIAQHKDTELLVFTLEAERTLREKHAEKAHLCIGVENAITSVVERAAFEPIPGIDFGYFVRAIAKSREGVDFYLSKFFDDEEITAPALALFVRFFPDGVELFCRRLEEKKHAMGFLEKVIDALKDSDTQQALTILERIYAGSNDFIRLEVLKAMQTASTVDTSFLLSILKTGDMAQKREALRALRKDESGRSGALEVLFAGKDLWGRKNRLLIENILAVEEAGFKVASDCLTVLAKQPFFWNRPLRQAATKVLKKWAL